MRSSIIVVIVLNGIIGIHTLSACPTCVGRIKAASPAFFSKDFYQVGQGITRETKEQVGHQELKKILSRGAK